MKPLVAFGLALSMMSVGCATRTRTAAGTLMVTGVVMGVWGATTFESLDESDDPEDQVGCILGGCAIAAMIAVAGAGLVVSGMVVMAADASEPAAAPAPISPASEISVNGPPALTLPLQRPLPDLEADGLTVRLARHVRSAVLRGDCAAAWQMMGSIRGRDRRYHDALAASSVLVGCTPRDA